MKQLRLQIYSVIIAMIAAPVLICPVAIARDNTFNIASVVMSDSGIPFILDNQGDVWAFLRPFTVEDPIKLPNLHHIKKLTSFMALTNNGHVYTWGLSKKTKWRGEGELQADYTNPKLINSLDHVSDISSVDNHFVAVQDRQYVYEWGKSFYKKYTDKEFIIIEPRLVYSNTNISRVATSGHATVILLGNKYVVGWGDNRQMQLGSDQRINIPPEQPARFTIPEPASEIFMSQFHSIVLAASGRVFFWGGCLQKDYMQQTKDSIRAAQGAIANVNTLAIQVSDFGMFPDTYLKRDGTIWLALAPLPQNIEQCQVDSHPHEFDHTQALGGMPVAAIAISTGGDGGAIEFTTLALGKDNTLWGANFRHPERGFKRLSLQLSYEK